MKLNLYVSKILFLLIPLQAFAVNSQSLDTHVSAGVGINTLEFHNEFTGGNEQILDAQYTTLNLGVSVSYQQYFMSLNAQKSVATTADFEQLTGGVVTSTNRFIMNRDDSSLSLGGQFDENTSLFVGYTVGTNSGGTQHEDKGIFYGIDYAMPMDSNQTLRLHLAYADLDGNPAGSCDYSGDTTGYSYGVTWSVPATSDKLFFIKLAAKQYEFDGTSILGVPAHHHW